MRKILIVGAGASGLHLAHGLLSHGYDVTVINSSTSDELGTSDLPPTQFSLPSALAHEQAMGLAMWDHLAPRITGVTLHLHPPGGQALAVESRFTTYGVSVDRRVKAADWLEFFEDRGGKVVIHGITVTDLDWFSRMYDLIVLAVGHGELGQLLDRKDADRPAGARRALAQARSSRGYRRARTHGGHRSTHRPDPTRPTSPSRCCPTTRSSPPPRACAPSSPRCSSLRAPTTCSSSWPPPAAPRTAGPTAPALPNSCAG